MKTLTRTANLVNTKKTEELVPLAPIYGGPLSVFANSVEKSMCWIIDNAFSIVVTSVCMLASIWIFSALKGHVELSHIIVVCFYVFFMSGFISLIIYIANMDFKRLGQMIRNEELIVHNHHYNIKLNQYAEGRESETVFSDGTIHRIRDVRKWN